MFNTLNVTNSTERFTFRTRLAQHFTANNQFAIFLNQIESKRYANYNNDNNSKQTMAFKHPVVSSYIVMISWHNN